MVVSLCRKTVAHFRHLLASTHHSSIFLGVRGGGCNGLKYVVAPTSDAPSRLDEELTLDGVHVIVCGKSLLHLQLPRSRSRSRIRSEEPEAEGSSKSKQKQKQQKQ